MTNIMTVLQQHLSLLFWLVKADLQNQDTRLVPTEVESEFGTVGHCKGFREVREHAPDPREKITNLRSSNCWN